MTIGAEPESPADVFAREWITAWNAHDVDRILEHYDEHVEFTSPFVSSVCGVPDGTLRGKEALRGYFEAALSRYDDLHFRDLSVFVGATSITVVYLSRVAGTDRRAAETMVLEGGRAVRVLCHYDSSPG